MWIRKCCRILQSWRLCRIAVVVWGMMENGRRRLLCFALLFSFSEYIFVSRLSFSVFISFSFSRNDTGV